MLRARKMPQWIKALDAKPDSLFNLWAPHDRSSCPLIHMYSSHHIQINTFSWK